MELGLIIFRVVCILFGVLFIAGSGMFFTFVYQTIRDNELRHNRLLTAEGHVIDLVEQQFPGIAVPVYQQIVQFETNLGAVQTFQAKYSDQFDALTVIGRQVQVLYDPANELDPQIDFDKGHIVGRILGALVPALLLAGCAVLALLGAIFFDPQRLGL